LRFPCGGNRKQNWFPAKSLSLVAPRNVLAKLRVRLGEYEQLTQEERFHYVAEMLETELAAGLPKRR